MTPDRVKRWYQENKERKHEHTRAWRRRHPDRVRAIDRKRTISLKARVVTEYGGKCQCCGEENPAFLTLDHVADDGHVHRQRTGNGKAFYTWLKARGWPKEGLRLMCFNCNCGRRVNGGICPHRSGYYPLSAVPLP